ncbi:MAG: carboxylesterase [Rhodobacteraceae bacterium]|nr:carboxylesterase [Paracoccaceae bacterium]
MAQDGAGAGADNAGKPAGRKAEPPISPGMVPTGTIEAETPHGRVLGQVRGEGLAFLGLPYGADTGGARRFLPPAPVEPWSGLRDATRLGDAAPQAIRPRSPLFDYLGLRGAVSEDCLRLNVHTPGLDGERPVMVWLHGGAFAFGAGNSPGYDGGALAARGDVVVVTVNHRLNAFGYLTPETRDPRFAASGMAGMLDLCQALEWVRDAIAGFGGDPGNVTIFGQSGGGAKAAILMAMERARGLFHRAIIQSPSSGFRVQEPEETRPYAADLARELGLAPGDMAGLQAAPMEDVLDAMGRVLAARGMADRFRPTLDGISLAAHPFHPEAPAISADIPVMIGYAEHEATFHLAADRARREGMSDEDLLARVARFMQVDEDEAAGVIAAYARTHAGASNIDLLADIAGDHLYRLTTIEGGLAKARQGGAPVWLYAFRWESPAAGGILRSPHTAELPFVFGRTDLAARFADDGPRARAYAETTMDAWLRFARHGDPNGGDLPPWTPLSGDERPDTMVFSPDGCAMVADPAGEDRAEMARHRRFRPGSAFNFLRL